VSAPGGTGHSTVPSAASPTPAASLSDIHSAEVRLVVAVLIWGANFSFIKLGMASIPGLGFAGLRFTAATILLFLLLRWREGRVTWPAEGWGRLILLGLLGNTGYQILFMYGLSHTSVGNVALLVGTSPVMVAVLASITGIERLTAATRAGVVLAFGGVLLVLSRSGLRLGMETLRGDAAVFLASLCWAGYTLLLRNVREPMSSLRVTALTMLTGTPVLLLLGLPTLLQLHWARVTPVSWAGTAYATLLGLIVAYLMWNNGVKVVGSARTAVFGSGTPVAAMFLAWPILGERPQPLQLIGAALIVSGVLLSRRRPGAGRVAAGDQREELQLEATGPMTDR
jgi:drug/metabolite transporter (DMT)-like permease